MKMKSKICRPIVGGLFALTFIGILLKTMAQSVPPPVIKMVLTNTNQLSITVTNGVTNGTYSLYNQHVLGSPDWNFVTNGAAGVTNFIVNTEPYLEGYYYVTGTTNFNLDYADPNNPGLGVLTLTIVNPSQGQIIQ